MSRQYVRGIPDLKRRFRQLERVTRNQVLNSAAYAGGLQVEAQCKTNIRFAAHELKHARPHGGGGPGMVVGLIDTGFMINSVYTVSPDDSNYSDAASEAGGKNSQERMLSESSPKQHEAIVTVGAEYFRWIEEGTSRMDAIPTLKPAADQSEKKVIQAVEEVIEKELRKVAKWPI